MQCVILAAGLGTRLRPLTNERPKPLVEVAGQPLVRHVLEALPECVSSVVIVVGYRDDQIRAYCGVVDHGRSIRYVEQGSLQSTGGALISALPILEERFMVMNADDIHGAAALERLTTHRYAVLAAESAEPQQYGVLTRTHDGALKDIIEKPEVPESNLVSTGVMVLDRLVFELDVPLVGNELRLTDLATAFAKRERVDIEVQDLWLPVGRPEDIPVAEATLTTSGATACAPV